MGKLKIKISDTQWKEIDNLDNLTIAQLKANQLIVDTKLQTSVSPTAGNDVINKTYLDAQIAALNKTITESGGLYVANSSNLTGGIPAADQNNKLWIDTNTSTGGLKYYSNGNWIYVPVAFS